MGNRAIIHICVIFLFLSGCANLRNESSRGIFPCADPDSHATRQIRTEMYFGMCKSEKCETEQGRVSDREWQYFVDTYIMPRFSGFTVMDASGVWKSPEETIFREKTKLLIFIHGNEKHDYDAIEAVKSKYKDLFNQQSVLVVNTCAEVSF